jgi:hypothetical protein
VGLFEPHLCAIKAIQGKRFQIGNNRGRINGWASAGAIYGRCASVEREPTTLPQGEFRKNHHFSLETTRPGDTTIARGLIRPSAKSLRENAVALDDWLVDFVESAAIRQVSARECCRPRGGLSD